MLARGRSKLHDSSLRAERDSTWNDPMNPFFCSYPVPPTALMLGEPPKPVDLDENHSGYEVDLEMR